MIELRPFAKLGVTRSEWLHARHHFSFAGYHCEGRHKWGCLRALNHNILPARGVLHSYPVDNVEILTFVRRGVLGHAGTFGERSRTLAGQVQIITAGTGIEHGDVNLNNRPAEYFEVRLGLGAEVPVPSRQVIDFPSRKRAGQLVVLASGLRDDRQALPLQSNARIAGTKLPAGCSITYTLAKSRYLYVLAATGRIVINDTIISAGSAAAIFDEPILQIVAQKAADLILIDSR